MHYLSLYRKWRPGAFEDVLGQEHVTQTLRNAIREERVGHAYLFAGPRGTGKTSTARILARALNCERGVSATPCGECTTCREIAGSTSLDVFEMDAASHTSVDDVREIRDRIPFAAVGGGRKVYIIDEAHQLSTAAFNALLKMLEEPPPHVIFVLCTTESHKLPATVVSRCQRFEFRRIGRTTLVDHLAHVAKAEGAEAEEAAVRAIARHAHGSMRDALSLLDQVSSLADGPVTAAIVLEVLGETPEDVLIEFGEAVGSGDVLSSFRLVEQSVDRGWDPRQLLLQILEHLRALLLARRGADELLDIDEEHRERLREQAGRFGSAHLEWALRVLGEAQADVRWSAHPRLTLEVALARASRLDAEDASALMARVERLERILMQDKPAAAAAPAPAAATPPPASAPAPAPKKDEPKRAAKAEPVAPPAPPAAAVPAAPIDGSLQEQWTALLDLVRSRSRVSHTHLKEAWPIEVAKGELVLGFEREFHAGELQKRTELANGIMAAAAEVFGAKLRLRCEVLPGGRPGRTGEGAESEGEPIGDPVGHVVRELGAEIMEDA